MYWFWYFLLVTQPEFLLLGMLGLLGGEAKRAAEDLVPVYCVIILILIVLGVIYLMLKGVGTIQ